MSTPARRRFVLLVLAALLGVAACGGGSGGGSGHGLRVVAAENVYGDLVHQVGGSLVDVTSILTDPTADPHLFTTSVTTGLAVSRAGVVVDNGLGYDPWMDRLLAASPNSSRRVITVADVLGVHGSAANPHLWYDVPRMPNVVRAIGAALTAADPGHRTAYVGGVRRTLAALQPLIRAVAALKATYGGASVAYTERVPGYLLDAAGLVVRTPPAFARAVEDGTDPPPAATNAFESLIRQRQIKVLLYNSQAVTRLTARMQSLARAAGVPVVAVTETIPLGQTFQSWQLGQVMALDRALSGR